MQVGVNCYVADEVWQQYLSHGDHQVENVRAVVAALRLLRWRGCEAVATTLFWEGEALLVWTRCSGGIQALLGRKAIR